MCWTIILSNPYMLPAGRCIDVIRIGVTVFNSREGGQQPDGSYDFTAGTDAIAAEPTYLDLIVV